MATRRVGVRELKNEATQLVRQAAAGERILVTRHGRTVAALVPATDVDRAAPETAYTSAWLAERAAFDRLLPKLLQSHRGRYVAVRGGRLVGSADDPDELFAALWPRSRGRAFYIGRVGAPEPLVDMPGFTVE